MGECIETQRTGKKNVHTALHNTHNYIYLHVYSVRSLGHNTCIDYVMSLIILVHIDVHVKVK